MTLTIRDISAAHREDIEALYLAGTNAAADILVAVAEQLECFEARYYEPTLDGLTDRLRRAEWQAVLQVWESAYEAAGGVVEVVT